MKNPSPIDERPYYREALDAAGVLTPPQGGMLYHYTSASGLISIVESKQIFATEVEYFADTSDGSYGFSLLEPELARFDVLGSRPIVEALHTLIARDRSEHRFAACFTEHADLPSQWRGYASNGAGYALGFEHSALAGRDGNRPLLRITYGDDAVKAAINRTIDWGLSTVRTIISQKLEDEADALGSALASMAAALVFLAFASKKDSFSQEGEWRLSYSESTFGRFDPKRVKFRDSGGLVSPYVALPLPRLSDGTLALRQVTCGPIAFEARRVDGVSALLEAQGIRDARVIPSSVPLRR